MFLFVGKSFHNNGRVPDSDQGLMWRQLGELVNYLEHVVGTVIHKHEVLRVRQGLPHTS